MTASYSHRDYSAPFDRGTIFDLNTGHAVNVDRKTRFDEAFNITDGYSDLAQLNAEYRLNDALGPRASTTATARIITTITRRG